MFDNGDGRGQGPLEDEPKVCLADAKFKKQIILIVVVAALLIVGIIAGAVVMTLQGNVDILPSGDTNDESKLFGLQNPNNLKDLDPITPEDRLEEFQSRPPMTENDISNFEKNITRFLNLGDFSGLSAYLQEQEASFRGPEEEQSGQAVEDWSSKFPLLSSDTQIATNLINKAINDPAPQFQVFSDPEILAAASIWAPITMKIDAFMDWSALILPPPDKGSNIQLVKYEYEDPEAKLAEITEATGTQYYDVCSYDAVVTGHDVRITMVKGLSGYWAPFSVQDIGGTMNSNVWTKAYLKNELEPRIHYRSNLDEVCFLSPPDDLPSKEEHPDWYDEEGIYIGPGSEYQPPTLQQSDSDMEGEPQAGGAASVTGDAATEAPTETTPVETATPDP